MVVAIVVVKLLWRRQPLSPVLELVEVGSIEAGLLMLGKIWLLEVPRGLSVQADGVVASGRSVARRAI